MEKLEIEFRYMDAYINLSDDICEAKPVFVALYEKIEDAVEAGNKILSILSDRGFEIRAYDKFKLHGLFGSPDRLVSNCCYRPKIVYYAKITNIGNNSIEDAINNALEGVDRYRQYKIKKSKEEID